MSTQELIDKINKLPPAKKQEVEDFIDFVAAKGSESKTPDIEKKSPETIFGIMKGKVWMSDDFDEPLEDFKDYM
jgi:Protein of unknown function (DUF2281)